MEDIKWWTKAAMDVLELHTAPSREAGRKTCSSCRHGQPLNGWVSWCNFWNMPTGPVACMSHEDRLGGQE